MGTTQLEHAARTIDEYSTEPTTDQCDAMPVAIPRALMHQELTQMARTDEHGQCSNPVDNDNAAMECNDEAETAKLTAYSQLTDDEKEVLDMLLDIQIRTKKRAGTKLEERTLVELVEKYLLADNGERVSTIKGILNLIEQQPELRDILKEELSKSILDYRAIFAMIVALAKGDRRRTMKQLEIAVEMSKHGDLLMPHGKPVLASAAKIIIDRGDKYEIADLLETIWRENILPGSEDDADIQSRIEGAVFKGKADTNRIAALLSSHGLYELIEVEWRPVRRSHILRVRKS